MNETQRRQGKAIHRETGRTFYYATRLLPADIRDQTYVLYGFFRIADEIVDGGSELSPERQRTRLEEIRQAALGQRDPADPIVAAFADIRRSEGIDAAEVNAFIDAMQADIDTDQYETYADLEAYMRGSAAAVGIMMTACMDVDSPETRPHAIALGEAFQLTNFLRDVREDARELDRVYLPAETLGRFGATVTDVRACRDTLGVRRAVEFELQRAETRYRTGVEGIELLPADCQFPVLVAAVLSAEHHRLVRERNFDVVSARPTVSRARQLLLLARTAIAWRRLGDPVAVFERVSAVPDPSAETDGPTLGTTGPFEKGVSSEIDGVFGPS